jgi:hypothetical protein
MSDETPLRPTRLEHDAQGKPLYVRAWNQHCATHAVNYPDGGTCSRCAIEARREPSMQPLVIGITGRKRHGKDSVGLWLARQYGYQPLSFAGTLKEAAALIFGLTFEQLHGDTADKERTDPRWGKSSREILQLLGTEVGRAIHPEVWIRSAFLHAEKAGYERVVITDVRFPNEAEAVRARGGKVIKVVRPSLVTTDQHASEAGVDDITPDVEFLNDGTMDDLRSKVDAYMSTLIERAA